ncbi:hypothetical protein ARMGADRAFT_1034590 [Armillaria gallica]|uniref:Uncharacterized protein n=1 Tax=Armillaria gallica TaxID=47427 RepID=A0A2H3D1Q9_ARMGA|nr:hypothetical protein ARMGADRAFT_1034590 [Armillaria gallica]
MPASSPCPCNDITAMLWLYHACCYLPGCFNSCENDSLYLGKTFGVVRQEELKTNKTTIMDSFVLFLLAPGIFHPAKSYSNAMVARCQSFPKERANIFAGQRRLVNQTHRAARCNYIIRLYGSQHNDITARYLEPIEAPRNGQFIHEDAFRTCLLDRRRHGVFPYRQRLSDVYEKKSLNGTALW